jgi:seryl-tRNA synthetase
VLDHASGADRLAADLAPAGLSWQPGTGQAVLSGPLLRLAADCDRAFSVLASVFGAQEEQYPPAIPADLLNRLGYFSSFPHQVTFAVCLDGDDANLAEFAASPFGEGGVTLTRCAPVNAVLTPAACYHVYATHEGEAYDAARYFTTLATCFRREAYVAPLARQWAFRMREVVCVGNAAEVGEFLARARSLAEQLCHELSLPVTWAPATDPFFRPLANPKYLLQKVAPTKNEGIYGDGVAIMSVNLHHDHLGEAFRLSRAAQTAHTGCIAFGLERWLFALTSHFGPDPGNWPSVTDAATRAVTSGVMA